MKKIVLITGTSTGVGLKASLLFAKEEYQVYATMRNTQKQDLLLDEARELGVSVQVLTLDVTDPTSIQTAVNTIIEKEGRIDILINNAGAGFAKTTEQATEEDMEWVTDVNYHGVVRCTKAVLPHMRKQGSGHVINITSVGGLVGQPFNEFYCAAKFAVEGYTEALSSYLTDHFGIHFSLVEPGGITTEFMNSAVQNTSKDGKLVDGEYAPILQKYMAGMQQRTAEGAQQVYQTPEEVAQVILEVAENPSPPLRIRTSAWAEDFCRLKTQGDPDGTKLVTELKEKFL